MLKKGKDIKGSRRRRLEPLVPLGGGRMDVVGGHTLVEVVRCGCGGGWPYVGGGHTVRGW